MHSHSSDSTFDPSAFYNLNITPRLNIWPSCSSRPRATLCQLRLRIHRVVPCHQWTITSWPFSRKTSRRDHRPVSPHHNQNRTERRHQRAITTHPHRAARRPTNPPASTWLTCLQNARLTVVHGVISPAPSPWTCPKPSSAVIRTPRVTNPGMLPRPPCPPIPPAEATECVPLGR